MAEKAPKIARNRLMEGGFSGKKLLHEAKAAHQVPPATLPSPVRRPSTPLSRAIKHVKGL